MTYFATGCVINWFKYIFRLFSSNSFLWPITWLCMNIVCKLVCVGWYECDHIPHNCRNLFVSKNSEYKTIENFILVCGMWIMDTLVMAHEALIFFCYVIFSFHHIFDNNHTLRNFFRRQLRASCFPSEDLTLRRNEQNSAQ